MALLFAVAGIMLLAAATAIWLTVRQARAARERALVEMIQKSGLSRYGEISGLYSDELKSRKKEPPTFR